MEYKIVYSDRRTISICVKDLMVTVRAPRGTSEKRIKELVSNHEMWIEKQLEKQRIPKKKDALLTDEEIVLIKKNAKLILKYKTEYYARIMGINYGRITITSAKTRFGSCSSKGDISYSWRLMLYPEEAIDYVVVHELAHRKEMNHSSAFYKIIEKVFPDYKVRRSMLKK